LDRQELAAGLQELARNASLRTAAAGLGEQIRAEDGLGQAVRLIEATFA
jgi:UDP:flavonoid glycosyltransferase YjiC (YdhE family)